MSSEPSGGKDVEVAGAQDFGDASGPKTSRMPSAYTSSSAAPPDGLSRGMEDINALKNASEKMEVFEGVTSDFLKKTEYVKDNLQKIMDNFRDMKSELDKIAQGMQSGVGSHLSDAAGSVADTGEEKGDLRSGSPSSTIPMSSLVAEATATEEEEKAEDVNLAPDKKEEIGSEGPETADKDPSAGGSSVAGASSDSFEGTSAQTKEGAKSPEPVKEENEKKPVIPA
jgi:hypothetical protein